MTDGNDEMGQFPSFGRIVFGSLCLMRSWEVAYRDILRADFIRQKNAARPEQYARSITGENAHTYVIQQDETTVGVMRVDVALDDDIGTEFYELHYIYLHPDCFRQGIGTQAMEFAFDLARALGKTDMTVWVFAENTNSIRFYEKCGFVADGTHKSRDFGRVVDSIRMRKRL